MPCTAVCLAVRKRASERAVRVASFVGGRGTVDRRSRQRVAELDAAVTQRNEPGRLGCEKLVHGAGTCTLERLQVAGVAGGREHERLPRALRKRLSAANEPSRDTAGDRRRCVDRELRQTRCVRRELEQRERVTSGRGVEPVGGGGADERGSSFAVQPVKMKRPQLRSVDERRLRVAHGDHDRDRIDDQSADREQHRVGARPVEPVRVVDEGRDRHGFRIRSEQAKCRCADCESVAGVRGSQRERAFECNLLGRGNAIDVGQRRTQQLEQSGERHACLGLDPARVQDAHARGSRLLARVLEQRRLADPHLTGDDEHGAAAQAGAGECGLELVPLQVAAEQHRPIVRRD
jgi:hypothetical protein